MKQRRAKVVYSYAPQNQDELELKADDVIDVLDEVEEGWWRGKLRGKVGVFPSNFVVEVDELASPATDPATGSGSGSLSKSGSSSDLDSETVDGPKHSKSKRSEADCELEIKPKQVIGVPTALTLGLGHQIKAVLRSTEDRKAPKKPPPPTPPEMEPAPKLPPKPVREQAKVIYAYEAQNEDELSIKEGDIISIISKEIEDQGWWRGELSGRVGVFPDNFVEILKVPVAEVLEALPPRLKKPERPSDKTSSPSLSTSPHQGNKVSSPSSATTGAQKATDKSTVSSLTKAVEDSAKSSLPVIPVKKPKLPLVPAPVASSVYKLPGTQNINKPDVVPQEKDIVAKTEKEENGGTNEKGNESQFSELETGNKLFHPTANRPKGPNRRPPSYISVPKDTENGTENGDLPKSNNVSSPSVEQTNNKPQLQPQPTVHQPQAQPQTQTSPQQLPPWMVELRKTQEEKRKNVANNSDEAVTGKEAKPGVAVAPGGPSPTKTDLLGNLLVKSPNRLSGDFTNKFGGSKEQPNEGSEPNVSNPISILKPSKPLKPGPVPIPVTPTPTPTPAPATAPVPVTSAPSVVNASQSNSVSNVSKATNATLPSSTISPPSYAVSTKHMGQPTETASNKEIADILKEVKVLKETMVSRKEYEELLTKVSELKEMVENQKQSYGTVIKDLINDVAEERKKLATLQIEVDRLRRLTTTV